MIELIASGPVEIVEDVDVNRQDGWDPIRGSVRTTRELEVTVDLEFPQGHVNLEGFAASSSGGSFAQEIIERYVGEAVDPPSRGGGIRVEPDRWDFELAGKWFDWVQAAHRYQVERPNMSIVGCLLLFKSWDETDDHDVEMAIQEARKASPLADVEVGEMSDESYQRLADGLRDHSLMLDNFIEDSYRPEQRA